MANKPKTSLPLRRRSGRILLRLPLIIGSADPQLAVEWENVETIMVSFHGGMVRTRQDFKVGTILEIRLHDRDSIAHARVVWTSAEKTSEGLELGFEIVDQQGFWGIKFPPDSCEERSED